MSMTPTPDNIELFQRFLVAVAIGLLIGLERGWQERGDKEGGRSAGLRTLALSGLLGAVWGAIAVGRGPGGVIALGLAFAVYALALGVFRYRETAAEGTFGMTTLVAGMIAFSLGGYAVMGDPQVAAAAGVATAALLALKRALHDWVRRLTWEELRSALVLAAMTFIALPVLPDRPIEALGGLNPREVWLMTILIAAISFAGYVAVKMVGPGKGIFITAVTAGLVSSTAATLTLARMARQNEPRSGLMAAGALVSGATMLARVAAVVALLNTTLLPYVLPALAAACTVLALGAAVLARRYAADEKAPAIALGNPFETKTVLTFGALLAAVMLVVGLAVKYVGAGAVVPLAAISGLADVDAMTLAMTRQAGAIGAATAAGGILAVVASNTLAKAALAWFSGGAGVGRPMLVVSAIAIVAGGLAAAGVSLV
ncbi:MAG: MgtC/SapB family protein [Hyphomicrobiaceae bacterium]